MRIVVVGFGKLGKCITQILLQSNGIEVVQVYNRTPKKIDIYTELLDSTVNNLADLVTSADVYFITVSDHAIAAVVEAMPKVAGLVVHMSGATPMETLLVSSKRVGVLWPMKSIGNNTQVISPNTICYEGNTAETTEQIQQLAKLFTPNVLFTTQLQRQQFHLLATIASNFTNHLYALTQQYCSQNGLPFDVLQPLIEDTATRLANNSAFAMQTGPAVRGDEKTIATHRQLLQEDEILLQLYNACTASIQLFHNR